MAKTCFRWVALALLLGVLAGVRLLGQGTAPPLADLQRLFVAPPDDARIMMRWWWFGSGVTHAELKREILAMKAGGIGGFEIQPVYPLALDDSTKGFRNLPYLSEDFLDAVRFAATTAREQKMRVDMTLASGWPYGGPHVPVTQAAGRLRIVAVDVAAGTASVPLPHIANGESLLAAFLGPGSAAGYDEAALRQLSVDGPGGRVPLPASEAARVALFFVASRTGQQVKRPAVDADGFVLDHFDQNAIENHLRTVGEPLLRAFGDHPPYAVFSDSLEVYGSDWTPGMLREFARRRGYDLTPHLPQIAQGTSEEALAVRHDWGQTLTELVDEHYLTPINAWATAHHTRFRSQTYGEPAVSLSSNALVALPEGEGPQWRRFSYTRWATSASHLYGRPVTSAETWTWLHSPAFRATPLDMKAEADLFFLEGVNQLIGHGWPYTPPGTPEPGWAFYAAAVFNDHNPWWPVMPDITRYLQRLSFLLRQGEPANDVAVLLPNDDAYTRFRPGHVALSEEMPRFITPELTGQILNGGYGFDYIDAEAIARLGIHHAVLVLPHVDRLAPAVLAKIAEYAAHGGKVIAIGDAPRHGTGLAHAAEEAAQVHALGEALFHGEQAKGKLISADAALGAALKDALPPDVAFAADAAEMGFVHRRLAGADVYFLVNTSNHEVHSAASFRSAHKHGSAWNALSGVATPVGVAPLRFDLAPYESRVIVLSDVAASIPPAAPTGRREWVDLSTGWTLTFPTLGARNLPALTSWTMDEATRFYSGEGVYTRDFDLAAASLKDSAVTLDFGPGTPVAADPREHNGMRALLESPIREAAVVFVNGLRAGPVWCPPYALDITAYLHVGTNHLELRVGNTAINTLAGRTLPDYRLLNDRYGQRFVPQDMDHLEPLPSGILGPVHLLVTRSTR